MCIIFVNETKRPSDDVLLRADDKNPDGIGIAWREKGQVRWEKGLNIEQLLSRLHSKPLPFPNVIHFRQATVGGEISALCHPFVASPTASTALKGSAKSVLFHNGHWSPWEFKLRENLLDRGRKIPAGPWSDSRALAWFVGVYGKEVLEWLDLRGEQRIILFENNGMKFKGKWTKCDGFYNSDPTYPYRDGPINITPSKEFAEKTKLSKKERRRLRKEAEKSVAQGFFGYDWEEHHRNKLKAESILAKPIPSWEASSGVDSTKSNALTTYVAPKTEEEKKTWPAPGATREDTLPTVEIISDNYWRIDDLNEILQEVRVFNWKTFNMMRPKMPALSV